MRKTHRRRFGAVIGVLVLTALVVAGCQLIADVRDVSLYPDCIVTDCPAPENPCQAAICAAMTCGIENVSGGTIVPAAAGGTCVELVCDGNGTGTTQGRATGTVCANDAGAGVCNDGGACVACNDSDECDGGVCAASRCVAATCADGVQDGNETGTDCGGSCPPCADGMGCNKGSDCVGGACDMGTCCTPKTCAALGLTCGTAPDGCGGMLDCNDGKKDGTETDVDCGGMGDPDAGVPPCPPCPQKDMCLVGSDCTTGLCQQDICCGTTCTGVCMQCNLSGFTGTCTPTPKGQDGTGCSAVQESACDGTGQCKYLQGHRCGDNADCLSGECTGPPPPQFSYCM